jgi:protein ImuA
VDGLRHLLPQMENVSSQTKALSFGLPDIDSRLPHGGLAFGSLHEVVPAAESDMPAAFGFVVALLGRISSSGPVVFVATPDRPIRAIRFSGHGLHGLGLDPARVILVEAGDEQQALWALEESLRSGAPDAVVGMTGAKLDLKKSRRLHLAASESGIPLLLLRPAAVFGSSAAVTRWRVASASAALDPFGLIAGWRWRVALERCRNGRPGAWLLEFDDAYRFRLAAALADPALSPDSDARPLRAASA